MLTESRAIGGPDFLMNTKWAATPFASGLSQVVSSASSRAPRRRTDQEHSPTAPPLTSLKWLPSTLGSSAIDSGYGSIMTTPEKELPDKSLARKLFRKPQVSKLSIFDKEVPESVRNRFDDLNVLFNGPLYDYLTSRNVSTNDISIKLKYAGRCEATAGPWVVVQCSKTAFKPIKQFYQQPQVISAYRPRGEGFHQPSFGVSVLNLPPRQMASRTLAEVYGDSWQDAETLCGKVIRVQAFDETRVATLGGIIKVVADDGIRLYGMTAGHIIGSAPEEDSGLLLTQPSSDVSVLEIPSKDQEIIVGDEKETQEEESESGQWTYQDDDMEEDLWLDLDYDGVAAKEGLASPTHLTQGIWRHTDLGIPWPTNGHVCMASDKSHSSTMDWALIEFHDASIYRPNLLVSRGNESAGNEADIARNLKLPSQSSNRAEKSRAVVLLSGMAGPKKGKISASSAFLMMGEAKEFSRTYSVTLSKDFLLDAGDCGSWVVDAETDEVYGHVVASDAFGDAFIIPFQSTIQDIGERLAAGAVGLPDLAEILEWMMHYAQLQTNENTKTWPVTLMDQLNLQKNTPADLQSSLSESSSQRVHDSSQQPILASNYEPPSAVSRGNEQLPDDSDYTTLQISPMGSISSPTVNTSRQESDFTDGLPDLDYVENISSLVIGSQLLHSGEGHVVHSQLQHSPSSTLIEEEQSSRCQNCCQKIQSRPSPDPVSLVFDIAGVVGIVIQAYNAVMSAYDLYLEVKDVPSEYEDLRMGLLLEHRRLELWGGHVLTKYYDEKNRSKLSQKHITTWRTLEWILSRIREAFIENNQILEDYGQQLGLPAQDDLSDNINASSINETPHTTFTSVFDLIDRLSLSGKSPINNGLSKYIKRVKFVLTKKKKMRDLVIQLSHWNNGLDQLTSRLDQDSSRRRLWTFFSTSDTAQLQYLEAAADLLGHRDIQLKAAAKTVIQQGQLSEQPGYLPELATPPPYLKRKSPPPYSEGQCIEPSLSSGYRLEMDQLQWQEIPYVSRQIQEMAWYEGESVIVDWRYCQDDSWRRRHPAAYRRRMEDLIRILNSDLESLSLSILHCIGYLYQSRTITGYIFRLPSSAQPGQVPFTLYDLLKRVERPMQPKDIPDLGERFELAKALVTTVFNIHNIGWVHKNIQPKNILFWPKSDTKGKPDLSKPDLSKPYLIGFDISRPNLPGETSEKPLSHFEDDLYRHPLYKGIYARSFQPSFDIYSLGVILYEIGLWRNIAYQGSSKSNNPGRPSLSTHNSDPQLVERLVDQGIIMALKQYTGARYHDAVKSCLSRDFDDLWDMEAGDQQRQLQAHLEQFQNMIVDKLAVCIA